MYNLIHKQKNVVIVLPASVDDVTSAAAVIDDLMSAVVDDVISSLVVEVKSAVVEGWLS
jgi:hypothetical protein